MRVEPSFFSGSVPPSAMHRHQGVFELCTSTCSSFDGGLVKCLMTWCACYRSQGGDASQIWDVERALGDYISRSESRSLLELRHDHIYGAIYEGSVGGLDDF